MDDSIVKIESLRFQWSKNNNFKIFVPKLEVGRGKKVLFLGESGSGKTTLLSLICGFLEPLSGSISINDKIISDLTSTNKDAYRSDNIGIIFQQFNLLPYANVIDNIILPLYFSKQRSKKVENKINAAMNLCNQLRLSESILNQKASNLSVGQQQRVAVARALIGSPSIIVADEPTSSLDTEAQELFLDLMFDQISKNSSTLLMVSHDKSLTNYFDQVIDINEILVREN